MGGIIDSIRDSIYLNLIYEDRYLFVIDGFGMTLYLTAMTFILGTIIGALFCWLRRSSVTGVSPTVIWIKNLFIRLPTLVLLIMFAYMLFANSNIDTVILAILAFALKTGAYVSDIMNTALETVDKGEIEAGRTLGMSRFMVFKLVVLPQAIKSSLPVYKNQLIITMQETSLVGFLAINDLTRASSIISARTLDPYISIIITAVAYLLIGAAANLLFMLGDRDKHMSPDDFLEKG